MAAFAADGDVLSTQGVTCSPVVETRDLPARHLMASGTVLLELPGVCVGMAVSAPVVREPPEASHGTHRCVGSGPVAGSTRHGRVFAAQWKACLLVVNRLLLPAALAVASNAVLVELPLVHVAVTVAATGEGQRTIGDSLVTAGLMNRLMARVTGDRTMLANEGEAAVFVIEPRRREAIQVVAGSACWRIKLRLMLIGVTVDTGSE